VNVSVRVVTPLVVTPASAGAVVEELLPVVLAPHAADPSAAIVTRSAAPRRNEITPSRLRPRSREPRK
jgi:hypothetical protein